MFCTLIHGCANGTGLDTSVLTSAIPQDSSSKKAVPDWLASDGQAILSALSQNAGSDAAGRWWENPESGARGVITAYRDRADEGGDCLSFTTTLENFEGIGLYRGTACRDAAGVLRMQELASI